VKITYEDQKCRYCGKEFTPQRKNSPCCPNADCRLKHKQEYLVAYRSSTFFAPTAHKVRNKNHLSHCEFCGDSFYASNHNAKTCRARECMRKRVDASREYSKLYQRRKYDNRTSQQRFKERQKIASVDGTLPISSLSKATGSIREKILNAWVETVFDLTDQIHLLFSECQHIRGCSSSLLATCLHDGTPAGCWSMSLNKHR
jgi:hypothetical protein